MRGPTVNESNRDFATAIVWSLQSECMLPPKLRLAVFAMALLSTLSRPCVAGPDFPAEQLKEKHSLIEPALYNMLCYRPWHVLTRDDLDLA